MTTRQSVSLAAVAAFVLVASAWTQAGPQKADAPRTYTATKSEPVLYTPKAEIDEGFAKNKLVLRELGKGHYMVESAQRSKPGSPEIHLKDTDVTYVVKGSATLITGGTVEGINPQNQVRPGNAHPEYEMRGGKIVGGTTYHLHAGDSVVVPPGVPHWFSEVDPPFYYLNIKVRVGVE